MVDKMRDKKTRYRLFWSENGVRKYSDEIYEQFFEAKSALEKLMRTVQGATDPGMKLIEN